MIKSKKELRMKQKNPLDIAQNKNLNYDSALQSHQVKNVGSNNVTLIQDPTKVEYVAHWNKKPLEPKYLRPGQKVKVHHGYYIPTSDDGKPVTLTLDF